MSALKAWMKNILLVILGMVFFHRVAVSQQIAVPRIEQMPNKPSPYLMLDWKQVARGYDSLVYDRSRSGQYLPLVFSITPTNYPSQPSYGLYSYVGSPSQNGEAINVLPSVVGATLCGIDKTISLGENWVLMSQEYFNRRPAENVYLNSPVSSSGNDWWYDVMPNVFFYQIYSLYPHLGDSDSQFVTIARRWLEAIYAMGGSTAPWSHPSLEHRGWRLATMTPNNALPHEPEAGGSIAWILYNAYLQTHNQEYRFGAEMTMEELNAYSTDPAYELQLSYGTYLAARMNAEIGTTYDVEKMVNWCFDVSPIRSWGAIIGNWGGYDCSGLIGEVDPDRVNDYAFVMNTFEQIGALVPLVRYDDRFAGAIGKWVLNAANACRLFYPNYLPDVNQDSRSWSAQYDPRSYIAHEAMRQFGPGQVQPYATGDAINGRWAATNLSLYSSSHAGILGAIIDTTNVPGILKLDLLKTDYFHDIAYPSFLFFNPDSVQQSVQLSLGAGSHNVYDAVSKTFVMNGVSGMVSLPIPARSAVVAVVTPNGGVITYDEEKMLVNSVIVDYRYTVPANYRPHIKGLGASPRLLDLNGSTQVYCTATDRDGDALTYTWQTSGGVVTGTGSNVQWTATSGSGIFSIQCVVADGKSGTDSAAITITVVDSSLSVPVITGVVARPAKVNLGGSAAIVCHASDPKGYPLSYSWLPRGGTLIGVDSIVQWTAPSSPGNIVVTCIVNNSHGGLATDSVLIPVRDFSQGGSGDLILFMPFNGDAGDQSGLNNNGSVNGAILVPDRFGVPNHAFGFDGGTANIRVPNSPSLSCASAITVSFWMKTGNLFTREMFPLSHGSWQNRWKVSIIPEHRLRWTIKTTTGVKDLDSRTIVAASEYYFVTGIYNGSDFELYVNGELESFTSWSGALLTPPIDLMVGQMLPTDASYNFQGVVDDIRIYNYALTYPQVQDLYAATSPVREPGKGDVPERTSLSQNFPNPFNPSTVLRFTLDQRSRVRLAVFDLLGREVAVVVDGELSAGNYQMPWNASHMASGIYFYRMSAHPVAGGPTHDWTEQRKMTLIR